MKTILTTEYVLIPSCVRVSVKSRVVMVKGPRGTLKRNFRHMPVSFRSIGNRRLAVEKYFGVKKEKAAVRTIASHIKNMIDGVTAGYRYKMKAVYAHFPINLVISEGGKSVEVKNFLGEKHTRLVRMLDGVTASQTGQKDEIQLEGNDLELVSRSAALIHQCSKVPNKDIRQFLDGVYVSETAFIHQQK